MKAVVESYVYDGPHQMWDVRRKRLVLGHLHYDWRFRIVIEDELVVYRRSGFCSWDRAMESLQLAWPKVARAFASEFRPRWLQEEFERARERSEQVPAWAGAENSRLSMHSSSSCPRTPTRGARKRCTKRSPSSRTWCSCRR